MDYEKQSELLKALAHPVRLKIAHGLMNNECDVTKMVKALGLPQSTVSQHLSVLKSHGIIKGRKEGVRTCYRVTNKTAASIIRHLKS